MREPIMEYEIPAFGGHPSFRIEIKKYEERPVNKYRTIIMYWDDDNRPDVIEWHPSLRQAKGYCLTLIKLYQK